MPKTMKPEDLAKFTPEEKRIRIAEICFPEYKDYPLEYWWTQENDYDRDLVWKKPLDKNGYRIQAIRAPDYLNDLNAMQGARRILNSKQQIEYAKNLNAIVNPDSHDGDFSFGDMFSLADADATQHTDAFLLTLG